MQACLSLEVRQTSLRGTFLPSEPGPSLPTHLLPAPACSCLHLTVISSIRPRQHHCKLCSCDRNCPSCLPHNTPAPTCSMSRDVIFHIPRFSPPVTGSQFDPTVSLQWGKRQTWRKANTRLVQPSHGPQAAAEGVWR